MPIEIDFSEPRWLINYYNIIGIISFFLNSFGIYLLIFECKKLGHFRYYLLWFQTVCTLTDVHLNFFTQPIPLNPLLAIFTVGALSSLFDVSTHICAIIGAFLAMVQLESLIFCFAKKHQAIAEILKYHIVPDIIQYACYLCCFLAPIGLCGAIQYLYVPKEEQFDYIRTNYIELLPGFSSLKHFNLYIKIPNIDWLFAIMILGASFFLLLFFIFIFDIFKMMADLKLRLSRLTYKKRKEAVQSLMVQFITSLLCLGPPCILVIIVFLKIQNGQTISKFLIAWFTSQSSVNMVSLCFFFPPYRKFFVKQADKNRKRINAAASSVLF